MGFTTLVTRVSDRARVCTNSYTPAASTPASTEVMLSRVTACALLLAAEEQFGADHTLFRWLWDAAYSRARCENILVHPVPLDALRGLCRQFLAVDGSGVRAVARVRLFTIDSMDAMPEEYCMLVGRVLTALREGVQVDSLTPELHMRRVAVMCIADLLMLYDLAVPRLDWPTVYCTPLNVAAGEYQYVSREWVRAALAQLDRFPASIAEPRLGADQDVPIVPLAQSEMVGSSMGLKRPICFSYGATGVPVSTAQPVVPPAVLRQTAVRMLAAIESGLGETLEATVTVSAEFDAYGFFAVLDALRRYAGQSGSSSAGVPTPAGTHHRMLRLPGPVQETEDT